MGKISIGIDLGTSNCAAAYIGPTGETGMIKAVYGRVPVLDQLYGSTMIPSYIRFSSDGKCPELFGLEAREKFLEDAQLVVWGVKRLIGLPFSKLKAEGELERFLYKTIEHTDGRLRIDIRGEPWFPVDISRMLLRKVKEYAEKDQFISSREIGKVFVTFPAYFNPDQISLTKEAAEGAGFPDVDLIAEPDAAALAYAVQLKQGEPQAVLTIDWGAGTLDIVHTFVKANEQGELEALEIRPAHGDIQLGGMDMDDALFDKALEIYNLDEFRRIRDLLREGRNPPKDNPYLLVEYGSLKENLERAKIELSTKTSVEVNPTYNRKPLRLKMARTSDDREDDKGDWIILDETIDLQLSEARKHIEGSIGRFGLDVGEIDHLLLVGGPMFMPCVQRMIADIFKGNPDLVDRATEFAVSPMECVARGAALAAGGKVKHVLRKATRGYGIYLPRSGQGTILVNRGTALPYEGYCSLKSTRLGIGQGIQVSLYAEEVHYEGTKYIRKGNYEFHSTVDEKNSAHWGVRLCTDKYGCIDAKFTDLIATGDMTLTHFYRLGDQEIDKPEPFDEESPDDDKPPTPPTPQPIPEEYVNVAREKAEKWLKNKSIIMGRAEIRNLPPANILSLKNAFQRVEEALGELPQGDSSSERYNAVLNLIQELKNIAETMSLLE